MAGAKKTPCTCGQFYAKWVVAKTPVCGHHLATVIKDKLLEQKSVVVRRLK